MDRPYSSKARKSHGRITINSEASEKLKALFPEQSDTRLVSPFAGNVSKENEESTELKTSTSNINEATYDNTCGTVNSLPKIVITAADDDKKNDINLTTAATTDKKCSQPPIKAPLLSNSRLQVPPRIQSASVRGRPLLPTRPLVKVVSTTTLGVRRRPIGGNEKPNTVWHSGKPIAVDSSALSAADNAKPEWKQKPTGSSEPEKSTLINVVKKSAEISQVILALGNNGLKQPSTDTPTPIKEACVIETSKSEETPSLGNISTADPTDDVNEASKPETTKETPSLENISTADPIDDVNEATAEVKLTAEDMHMTDKVLAQFPSVMQRIRTARSRGAVIPPPDYDADDSDDEYEEDTDSSYEESDQDKKKTVEPKCSSDDDKPDIDNSNVDQQLSISQSSSESVEEVYECDVEEHEQQTASVQSPRPPTESMVVNKSISGGELNGILYPPCVIPRYQRRSSFPQLAKRFKGLPQAFSMPSLVTEPPKSPVLKQKPTSEVQRVTSAPPEKTATAEEDKEVTLSLLNAMTYQLKVMAGRCSPSDFLPTQTQMSAALQPQGMPRRRRELTKSQIRTSLTSQYAFTPLKMIIGELMLLHHDALPTEVCPVLNRSPSFVGECNGDNDDGLLSGRSSPKLDIPRRHYCSRLIHQHPLAKYIHRMKKPIRHFRDVYKSGPSTNSSDEEDAGSRPVVEVYTPDQLATKFGHIVDDVSSTKGKQNSYVQLYAKKMSHEKVPVPLFKPTSYLDMYKKRITANSSSPATTPCNLNRGIQFSKKTVLPPIGTAPELKQQEVDFVPKPPLGKPLTSGQFAGARKFRIKQLQNKKPQETSKLTPAPLAIDTTYKCKEHTQKVEKMKRKQDYSEALRKKQKPATWTGKTQQYTRPHP